MVFGTGECTLFLTSRFFGIWCMKIWMSKNVNIYIFNLIWNIIKILKIWDV